MSQRDRLVRATRSLHKTAGLPRKLPNLFFFTDERRVDDLATVVAGLPDGVGVIFRHYTHPGRLGLAAEISSQCRSQHRCLLIAGSPEIARTVGADGVHWPEVQFQTGLASRKPIPPYWIVTTAVHSLRAICNLRHRRVDAAFLSPIFPTASHPDRPHFLGPVRSAALARTSSTPLYGLGGISAGSALRLKNSGLVGFGAIGALLS